MVNELFSNNAPVFVVFGVKTVKRKYNPSHVLPEEGREVRVCMCVVSVPLCVRVSVGLT